MKLLEELRNKGYRITKSRQQLLSILKDYPLTVAEIAGALKKKKISIDLASIYRGLELFKQMGIVAEIDLGEGKKRYELKEENKHHHHLVCNNCGRVEDAFSKEEENFIKKLQKKTKFSVQSHSLELFGLCHGCQTYV